MDPNQLLAFVALSVTVAVIPGPDMALVARNVFRSGRSAGYATTLGICTGLLGWAIAAAAGVTAILAASATAFAVLKLLGAAYLVYLGIRTLRAPAATTHPDGAGRRLGWRQAWGQGLLSALLNPKLGVFFLTVLPQFITPGADEAVQAVRLVLLFDAIGLSWLVLYATALGALGSAIGRPRVQRAIQRLTGVILIALGIRVAMQRT